jgi:hypothetical protein
MTSASTFHMRLPGWIWGGLFGCAVIIGWMAWNRYRPVTADETRNFQQRVASQAVVDCLERAERVYATRIAPRKGREESSEYSDYDAIAEPVEVSPEIWTSFRQLLLSPRSYDLRPTASCTPRYDLRLRAIRGAHSAEVWLSLRCPAAAFFMDDRPTGAGSLRPAQQPLRELAVSLVADDDFPQDE